MPPLFDIRKLVKERPKTVPEVLAKAIAALQALDSLGRDKGEKEQHTVHKCLGYLKFWLFGDEQGHEPTKENVVSLAYEVVKTDFQLYLIKDIALLEFETRKDAAQVFGAIVRIKDQEDQCPGAIYVQQHSEILNMLFEGYDDPSIALNCGSMYRDCIRDENIARMELNGPNFMEFFQRVEVANFEIASDAFSSFKDLLTRHKVVVAQYLTEHYQQFFDAYSRLMCSNNYVTRRQSVKLLADVLLDKSNVRPMMKYVSDVKNLMQMMNMLKDSSKAIQFEAFHVFKVFVANPNKPQPIVDILTNNREKLLKYLEDFHTERDDDEQFKEEKAVIIKEIALLGKEQQHQQPQQQPSAASGQFIPQQTGTQAAASHQQAAAPGHEPGDSSSQGVS